MYDGKYDLILLDLNLPGVDGLEILRQFRESDTSTPVLILSARGQIQDKVEGLDLGANDYLTKPFHFEELEARIRSLTRENLSSRMYVCNADVSALIPVQERPVSMDFLFL